MIRRFPSLLLAALLALLAGCNQPTGGGGGTGVEGLTGTLVEPGGEFATGALVRVYPVGQSMMGLPKHARIPTPDSTIVDTMGRFVFRDVARGVYRLVATWTHGDSSLALHLTNVSVQTSTDLGIQILQPTGSVVVELRDGNIPVMGARCRIPSTPFEAISDATGKCIIQDIPPGTFLIEVSGSGFQTIITDSVLIRSGMPSGLRVQLGATSLPSAPLLASPGPGAVVAPGDSLRWTGVQGAAHYELQVTASRDTAFESPLAHYPDLLLPRHPLVIISPETSYRWRVRARNAKGNSPWTMDRTYTVPVGFSLPE